MNQSTVIIPLPCNDFDPTETAVPWKILNESGYKVVFATVDGKRAHTDPLMLTGEGLDPWGWIPVLKKVRLIGLCLRAQRGARDAYKAMESDNNFNNPKKFADLNVNDYAGLFLPGGHAQQMRPFMENKQLQQFVAEFFEQNKPVAAICHGVVLAARATSPTTGRSVLYGKKTTALTWKLEKTAWLLTKFFARFWDGTYYRTYSEEKGEPSGHRGVESEVKRALKSEQDFIDVPKGTANFLLKTSGLVRDNKDNDKPAWVVEDGNYLSARWPGDVYTLSKKFVGLLKK
jgi:putative intracellular protease/amidase